MSPSLMMSLTVALEVQTVNRNCPVCQQKGQCVQSTMEPIPRSEAPGHRWQVDHVRRLPSAREDVNGFCLAWIQDLAVLI